MATILMTAENFAFGPIGKLLTIAEELNKRGHTLLFAGFGTSYQLAKSFPFTSIYEIDTDNPKSQTRLSKIMSGVDMLVSSMDLRSVIAARSLNKKIVYVDCLFWFWEEIPQSLFNVDLYVHERSINDCKDSENEKKYAHKIKHLFSVGPIIPHIKKFTRKRQALISYGGGEASYWYRVGRDSNYPFIMTKLLHTFVDWKDFDKVIVTTSERIVKELSAKFVKTPFTFTTCGSHAGFLKELAQSEILLTTAGLVTTQEAFQSKTPTIFLPPSNNSHYLLQDELHEQGFANASVHLSDVMPQLYLRGIKDEMESISAVMKQLRIVEGSQEIQKGLGMRINTLIANRNLWARGSVISNKRFLAKLGENGMQTVCSKISQLLGK